MSGCRVSSKVRTHLLPAASLWALQKPDSLENANVLHVKGVSLTLQPLQPILSKLLASVSNIAQSRVLKQNGQICNVACRRLRVTPMLTAHHTASRVAFAAKSHLRIELVFWQ